MCAVIFYEKENLIKLSWYLLKLLNKHNKIVLIEKKDVKSRVNSLLLKGNKWDFYSFDGEKLKNVEIL